MNNNKLIAEFMGMTRHDHDDGCMIQMTHQGNEVVLVASMKYHTSWDWLMPVIEKIGDENLLSTDIDIVYDRVAEFIKEQNDER